MKLIMLTRKFAFGKNTVICINVAHIIAFYGTDENETSIILNDGDDWMIVTESPDEVMKRIQFAKAM